MNWVEPLGLVISILFSVYSLAAGMECAVLLKSAFSKDRMTKLFTPIWEVTNVFLVFGFTGLAMVFNNSVNIISNNLAGILGVAIIAMLIRALLVLSIFYNQEHVVPSRFKMLIMALATFTIPLSFSAAGIYFFLGSQFWESFTGWVLIVTAFSFLLGSGVYFVKKGEDIFSKSRDLFFILWLLFLGCISPLAINHNVASSHRLGYVMVLVGLAAIGLLALMSRYLALFKPKLGLIAGLISLLSLPVFYLANYPWLINNSLNINSAYGAQAYGSVIVAGLAIMLLPISLGLFILIRELKKLS